jgi:hypothetical protein
MDFKHQISKKNLDFSLHLFQESGFKLLKSRICSKSDNNI